MNIKNYLWVFPFLSFLTGYLIIQQISNVDQLKAPVLVGKQLQKAVSILSRNNLNLRIITQKNDPDLPKGTVLSQTPIAGQNIKPHQAIYLVISKKPEKTVAPDLINKSIKQIEKLLKKDDIRNKKYNISSNCPVGSCIAQLPNPGKMLEAKKITTYISSGNTKPALLPDFSGKSVPEALKFLKHKNIRAEVSHSPKEQKNHVCDESCVIAAQRPLAGSIVNLDTKKPLLVQIQAKSN